MSRFLSRLLIGSRRCREILVHLVAAAVTRTRPSLLLSKDTTGKRVDRPPYRQNAGFARVRRPGQGQGWGCIEPPWLGFSRHVYRLQGMGTSKEYGYVRLTASQSDIPGRAVDPDDDPADAGAAASGAAAGPADTAWCSTTSRSR